MPHLLCLCCRMHAPSACVTSALHLQILAAEKAGSWSAALTLYEQALKNEGSTHSGPTRAVQDPGPVCPSATAGQVSAGLSTARRGHLSCLLQLGHLQALLAAVDGWMTRCPGESFPLLAYAKKSLFMEEAAEIACDVHP